MKKLGLFLALTALFFASCSYSGLDGEITDCNIQVDNLFVSGMRSAISSNFSESTILSINIHFSGGYSNSQWKDVALSNLEGTVFYFNDVPVDKDFDIYVGVYYRSELIYEASQENVRIYTNKSTELSLILKKLLNTQYALYQYDSNTYKYYLKNSLSEGLGTSARASGSNYFCFDADGNFYWIGGDTSVTINSDKDGFTEQTVSSSGYITVDMATNVLYLAVLTNNNSTMTVTKYPSLISSSSTSDAVTFTVSMENALFSNLAAVYDGVLYAVAKSSDEFQLVTANLSGSGDITATDLVDLSDYAEFSDNGAVTDILYQDGAVYVLARDYNDLLSNRDASSGLAFYSRGVIVKYDATASSVATMGFSDSSIDNSKNYFYGYYKNNGNNSYENFYTEQNKYTDAYKFKILGASSTSINDEKQAKDALPKFYAPAAGSEAQKFYGPTKFIAIKPKKLVIADDGVAFFADSNGAYNMKNVNRVVTVDLENFAISGVTDVKATFETDISDSIYSSAFSNISHFTSETSPLWISNGSSFSPNSGGETGIYIGIPLSE